MTLENKKPLFDEKDFDEKFCLIRVGDKGHYTIFDLEYIEDRDFVKKVKAFITHSIRKAQREAVEEVLEEFEQTLDDSGNASWTMAFADTIDRIRAKYQEGNRNEWRSY